MGRRALRKIDPTLDLSGFFLEASDLPEPFDASVLFRRTAPLEVEVGSGKGMFLAAAAAAHPERDFLGIEIARKYARFAAAKLAKAKRTNAAVVLIDAKWLFRSALPQERTAAVHVYFPDPWWKKRHKKRRIMTPEFVADVERTLAPDGSLHFWTDVEEYFQATLEIVRSATRLAGPFAAGERPASHDLDYRTHFERRMRLHDQQVYRAEFRKPA
jgi:tRNA (guanine-N7-)-methyltransferase